MYFFEQTYINNNLDTFAQLRISFEVVAGGAIVTQLRVAQLYIIPEDDQLLFYCMTVFVIYNVVQIFQWLRMFMYRRGFKIH